MTNGSHITLHTVTGKTYNIPTTGSLETTSVGDLKRQIAKNVPVDGACALALIFNGKEMRDNRALLTAFKNMKPGAHVWCVLRNLRGGI